MSFNGTSRKHAKSVGYIVLCGSGIYTVVGTACHGLKDSGRTLLLGGNPVTLFLTRRAAHRAIDDTKMERPGERFQILRVAPLK